MGMKIENGVYGTEKSETLIATIHVYSFFALQQFGRKIER
jgi:hypothetical protein